MWPRLKVRPQTAPTPDFEEVEARLGIDAGTVSPVAKLWLQSWDLSIPTARASMVHGLPYNRPFNRRTARAAVALLGLLWRNFVDIIADAGRTKAVFCTSTRVLQGCFPALRLWARKEMLDIVQKSFESPVPRLQVLKTAALCIGLAASEYVFALLLEQSDTKYEERIHTRLKRSYLAAKMSLSIPSQDSLYASALLDDAGLFCHPYGEMPNEWGGTDCISVIFSTFSQAVEVASQLFLLFGTISSGYEESHFSVTNIGLILLSLTPSLLRILNDRYAFGDPFNDAGLMAHRERGRKLDYLERVAQDPEYKQEVMMFQLRDWILGEWTKEKTKAAQRSPPGESLAVQGIRTALSVGQGSVDTIFHAILASRLLPTSLSLGTIEMYQTCANSMLHSVKRLMREVDVAFQAIFRFAAFVEATTDPDAIENDIRLHRNRSIPLLDYDTIRHHKGMKLEARDLSFTYPGDRAPTLKNLNFVIQPGETLAVVGVNGGGKTTLMKVLLGIYRHDGDLYVNDRPMESLDPRSLYSRTSCLFQDFARYALTISQNVVIGDTTRADKEEDITEAMRRGGAEPIVKAFGLGRRLTLEATLDATRPYSLFDQPVEMPMNGTAITDQQTNKAAGKNKSIEATEKQQGKDRTSIPIMPLALSGGQWQRVALSRAFLRADRADLIVFDEPSAALDPRAEAELFQRIHDLSSREDGLKPTTVYVSHRFSTVKKADRILVMEGGSIVEIGSHEELMALGGKYAEMFNLQKQGFE